MQRTRIVVVLIIVFAFLAGFAAGQRKIPTENAGQSEQELRSLDLTNELDSSKGRPLRMRKVTLQPGGVLGLHNHVDRPAVTYLLQGQMTYHQDGKPDWSPIPATDSPRPRDHSLGREHRKGPRRVDRSGDSQAIARSTKRRSR